MAHKKVYCPEHNIVMEAMRGTKKILDYNDEIKKVPIIGFYKCNKCGPAIWQMPIGLDEEEAILKELA